MRHLILRFLFLAALPLQAAPAPSARTPPPTVLATIPIGQVPSGFPVNFALLTDENRQYVAYYDAEHIMTVATRPLDQAEWQYQKLDTKVGWDSHNSIKLAMDSAGHLHLSGNMHCIPLVYFRTKIAGDIRTIERIPAMTGNNETRCTYPAFVYNQDHQLVFHYRDGSSGNGVEIYNIYDPATKTWSRLLDKPLTDGQGKMNAYMRGPTRGPDGWFHLAWVWRDTPDCSTNHDPSYARSRDLIHWQTIDGRELPLPITLASEGTLIDPVPAKGGIINGGLTIGFDSHNQPVAAYHKFDADGKTQLYAARFTDGKWQSRQLTHWDYRWEFSGGGSINFDIGIGDIQPHTPGILALPFSHAKYPSGLLLLKEDTLEAIGTATSPPRYPATARISQIPEMHIRWIADSGTSDNPAWQYALRWETLPHNRDRQPGGPPTPPSELVLYKFSVPTN